MGRVRICTFGSSHAYLMLLYFLLTAVLQHCCLSAPAKEPPCYEEYKKLVPTDSYESLVKIFSNKNLLVVDKLKELDDVFMGLPESTLSTLPTPKAFRQLNAETQKRIRETYYSKKFAFEEKLKALEQIIHSLPADQMKLIPMQTDLPGLVEFDVPVLLQFNGQVETHLLRNFMTTEEFEKITQIIGKKNLPEVTRARLVGRVMRDAYERHPANFPIPLGDSDPDVPEEVRRLGVHLMFAKNPFSNIELFTRALVRLKASNTTKSPKTGTKSNQTAHDQPNAQCASNIDHFEQLRDFVGRFQI